jgi:hypothetical protein
MKNLLVIRLFENLKTCTISKKIGNICGHNYFVISSSPAFESKVLIVAMYPILWAP